MFHAVPAVRPVWLSRSERRSYGVCVGVVPFCVQVGGAGKKGRREGMSVQWCSRGRQAAGREGDHHHLHPACLGKGRWAWAIIVPV